MWRFLFQKKENPPLRNTEVGAILCPVFHHGEVAQLVEHHVRNVGVESSNLFFSTIRLKTKSGFRPFGARRDFFYSDRTETSSAGALHKAHVYPDFFSEVAFVARADAAGLPCGASLRAPWSGFASAPWANAPTGSGPASTGAEAKPARIPEANPSRPDGTDRCVGRGEADGTPHSWNLCVALCGIDAPGGFC